MSYTPPPIDQADFQLKAYMPPGVNQVNFELGDVVIGEYYHGLRIQGIGELALCDVGNNPLRIRRGDTTYGIELVEVSDPNASRIRIKAPAGIKAIRKYS